MAERRTARAKGVPGAEKARSDGDLVDEMVDTKPAPALSAARAGRQGLQQIAELTGKAPEGVTGVEPAEDGWTVSVEVVEDRRVPSSTDILATYEAEIDAAGNLASYRRVRRYTRGHGDSGGAS